ncbi:spore germination protein [Camelliibacillus cellulosilyticus]|uniref:Spore germination protein n=1 Tax=Camelliibacillus cellulosilyticus TaxID=2174486 RepID=A0ABV9GQQ0_9BACL
MPSLVGGVKVDAVESSGVLNFGDAFYISPKTAEKVVSGAGNFPTGDFIQVNVLWSVTNNFDPDAIDTSTATLT